MRTKALLCAATIAAGAATSMAQNVYSLNVVGYINLNLTNGYNLIANQLDVDGYMTNNTLTSVFSTNLPNLTKVSAYNPATAQFSTATYSASSQKWIGGTAGATPGLQPASGVFVQIPTGVTPPTITLVGQVVQGTNAVTLYPGMQIASIIPPVSTGISSGSVGVIPAARLDKVQQYSSSLQTFVAHTYNGTTWTGGEPTPAVGEAFFYVPTSSVTTNRTWTQGFVVQ